MEESSECFAFKYLRINVVPLLFSCCPNANSTTQKTGQTCFWFRLVLCLMRPRRSREKCLIRGNVLVSLLTTWEKDSSAYRCEQILIGECPKKRLGRRLSCWAKPTTEPPPKSIFIIFFMNSRKNIILIIATVAKPSVSCYRLGKWQSLQSPEPQE